MSVLIVGASGLIGAALTTRLLESGMSVVCQSRNRIVDTRDNIVWIQHDLVSDNWDILDSHDISAVFYLSAQTSVYVARDAPLDDLEVNTTSFLRMLEYFRFHKPCTFIVHMGTATQVGLAERLPINHLTRDNPITFYDISKLTAELYLKQFVRERFVSGCTLRLSNVYGSMRLSQSGDRGVLDRVFNQARRGESITIYGDGDWLRDYIYIDDVVSALMCTIDFSDEINGNTFYISSGESIRFHEAISYVVGLAETIAGTSVEIEYVEPPAHLSPIEFRNVSIDHAEFTIKTGWRPKYDFYEGAAKAYGHSLD